MVAPTLNTYEYQYTDSGVLLNSDSTSLPFYDVTEIRGLDVPEINAVTSEYDNQHGGYVDARFVGLRTIIIEATLYCNPTQADLVLDTLIDNFSPRQEDAPFYYKGAGISQRYIMCKPIGLNYDLDNARNYGVSKVQIQLRAGDPLKYTDNATVEIDPGNDYSATNTGKQPTYPIFEVTNGAYSEVSFIKKATGEVVTLTYTADSNDVAVVDFRTRNVLINDERKSSALTSVGWWSLDPGVATDYKVVSTGANSMVNPDAEANYTTGYVVGSRWTGTQNYTAEKHKGTRSLRMVRNSKTAGNGNVQIPTGLSGLAAGRYSAWVWVKGTIPKINFKVLNNTTVIATAANFVTSSKSWKKIQVTFTLASTSGTIYLSLDDAVTGQKVVKDKRIYIDDMGVVGYNETALDIFVSTRNGYL